MKRALIVSDDAHTQAWIAKSVAGLDVLAERCRHSEMSACLREQELDLVIADGGHDAAGVVREIEEAAGEGLDVHLLLVVESDGLAGLRMPVRVESDFFVRGGSSDEVAARVRSLVWPGEEVTSDELVRVDDLTVNLATYQAHIGGVPIDFTYLEYALFAYLVTHPDRVYSREVLLSRVWGPDYFGGSRTVDVHVRRVRAKLGPELSQRLETVRNVGYLWRG